jgi:hypothetical protein
VVHRSVPRRWKPDTPYETKRTRCAIVYGVHLFAQNLVEHGSLDALASNLQRSGDTVGTWITNVSPTTWIVLGVVVVFGLIVWSRR